MEAASPQRRRRPLVLERSPLARLPDKAAEVDPHRVWRRRSCVIIAYFFVRLYQEAQPAFAKFGYLGFTFDNNWDVSAQHLRRLAPAWWAPSITSGIALLIGVPVAVATALYVTELCPKRVRGPLTIMVELLAAVPSVVYGLWGVVYPDPQAAAGRAVVLRPFGFLPFVGGHVAGPSYFIAGLILAIMVAAHRERHQP